MDGETSGSAVKFRNVSVRLGGQNILDDISATVRKGEIHCIVGPNGGGKTTLVKSLLGQMPHLGEIAITGRPGLVIGYAPQSLDLDRSLPLTVRDVMRIMNQRRPVFFGGSKRNGPMLDAALERMGLGGKARKLFGLLSGGERQRLLFAQALVPAPDLLVMDEPTSNMDEEGTLLVERIVRELGAKGTTVIWINHDWDQVRRVADTVTGISRTVTFSGPPAKTVPAPTAMRVLA